MRKWRPRDAPADEEWQVNHQIVIPRKYCQEILSLAHESPMAGHLGVNKTYFRILTHFYWPHLRKDVSEFCKCCDICQRVGKPTRQFQWHPLSLSLCVMNLLVRSSLNVLDLYLKLHQATSIYSQSCVDSPVYPSL